MEFKDIVLSRTSIRKFKTDVVKEEDIELLIKYAMSAPSACNKQPWEFYVVTNQDKLLKLRKVTRFTNYVSPLNIIVCGNKKRFLPLGMADYWMQDASAAIENILLGVTSLGLGAVWCGLYPQKGGVKHVQEILELDDKVIPLGLIHIGYPQEEGKIKDKYNKDYIHYVK